MNDLETILYEEQDRIATVTLNRPEVHNAFNIAMQLEMKEVWRSLRRNDDVRVVIITGARARRRSAAASTGRRGSSGATSTTRSCLSRSGGRRRCYVQRHRRPER
ncbi:MAG: enoyl-CoA hydratase/isomerase family protein [Acidimicrobiales bacterium]